MNDKLTQMYEMQAKLDERIINERSIDKSVDEWVVGLTIAMESEIDEIRREVNWKWWKNPKEIDKDALQGEVIDMWHFLLSLSRVVGLEADDIHRLYMEKNAENHARQDGTSDKEGYSAMTGALNSFSHLGNAMQSMQVNTKLAEQVGERIKALSWVARQQNTFAEVMKPLYDVNTSLKFPSTNALDYLKREDE